MVEIKLHLSRENWATIEDHSFVVGTAFKDNILTDAKEIARELPNLSESFSFWEDFLQSYNGFYSLIKKDENGNLFAAVDQIRSLPLFYSFINNCFYISDSAEWIRAELNLKELDPLTKDEFQLTGYVTGKETLFKEIKQIQAGECLKLVEGTLKTHRYYLFTHTEPQQYNEEELYQELYKVSKLSIERLIKYANGRQIVIPLSGGYDSRLIATLLKEFRYQNILCFTYGPKGNKEAAYSKIVADSLGLKWHFVEYTEELWNQAWHTETRKRYSKFASNYVSLPHIQDWLAVKVMHEQGVLEQDAVFVPGHSGDMTAGSHIPKYVFEDLTKMYSKDDLINHLFEKHYCLTTLNNIKTPTSFFKERIAFSIDERDLYSATQFSDEAEMYNWQNRQSKYICNSIRVYDQFGYNWWLPMWEKEFISFFENLPLKLRNHDWYVKFVSELYGKYSSSTQLDNASEKSPVFKIVYSLVIKNDFIKSVSRSVYRLFKKESVKNNAFCLVLDKDQYYKKRKQGFSVIGIFSKWNLDETIHHLSR